MMLTSKDYLVGYIKAIQDKVLNEDYRQEHKLTDGTRTLTFGYCYFSASKVGFWEGDTFKEMSVEDGVIKFLSAY